MTAFHQPYEPGVGAKLAVVKFVHDLDVAEGQQHACRTVLQVIALDLRSSSGSSAGMCYSDGMRSDPPRGPSLGPCVCTYMLRDSYLLQVHKLPRHGDNFQDVPDDDLSMVLFCLFCLLMKNCNLVKWASWPPTTVKSVCVCVCVCVCTMKCNLYLSAYALCNDFNGQLRSSRVKDNTTSL